MAKKQQQEDPPAGSPAWMATFSDLMNLLLCFFVLLFSMSSVDAEKFELVIASLRSSFSVLPAGGTSVGEGTMINSGMNQMEYFDIFYEASPKTNGNVSDSEQHTTDTVRNEEEGATESQGGQQSTQQDEQSSTSQQSSESQTQSQEMTKEEIEEQYEKQSLAESEEMSEEIEEKLEDAKIANEVAVDFNSQYVVLTLNGALLFESGQAVLKEEAYDLVDRVGNILQSYGANIIEIEGHTDNVPIHNDQFSDNNVLSSFRALNVMEYLIDTTKLDPAKLKSSGRGEYVPIATNKTSEGRAKNRRVEIKIYNTSASSAETGSE